MTGLGVNLESQVDTALQGGVPASLENQEVAEEDHGVRVESRELDRITLQGRSHHRHGRQSLVLTSGLLLLPFVIHQHPPLILPSLAQPPRLVNSVMTTMNGIGTHLAIHATMVPTKVADFQEYLASLHLQVVKLVVIVLQLFLTTTPMFLSCVDSTTFLIIHLIISDPEKTRVAAAMISVTPLQGPHIHQQHLLPQLLLEALRPTPLSLLL